MGFRGQSGEEEGFLLGTGGEHIRTCPRQVAHPSPFLACWKPSQISSLISCLIATKSFNKPDLSGLMVAEELQECKLSLSFLCFFRRNNFHVYFYIHRQQWQLGRCFRKFISSAIIPKETKLSSGT